MKDLLSLEGNTMQASIFIPTAHNLKALAECLDSLKKQSYKKMHLIIVGMRSDKNLDTLFKQYPTLSIRYIVQSKKGLVQAAQNAYTIAKGDIFIRIDDDVVTSTTWLENIICIFKNDNSAGAVTGPTLTTQAGRNARDLFLFFERAQKSANPFWKMIRAIYIQYIYENRLYDIGQFLKSGAFTLGSNFENSLRLENPIEVDNLEACNMAIRMSILKKHNGFDLIFNRGLGEYHEADIAYKIKKAGYNLVFSSNVRLEHKVETTETASKSRADAFHRISNFIIFYRRHLWVNKIDNLARFLTNVLFQNAYYCYKSATTGDWKQLGAIPGTIHGFLKKI